MKKPPKPCSKCGRAVVRAGLCQQHLSQGEQRRGSAAKRGYDGRHVRQFRTVVLERDPICVVCHEEPSTDADHYPWDRKELVRLGADPNDPRYGRGLCHSCHSRYTASTSLA